jgi:hypothetical protein
MNRSHDQPIARIELVVTGDMLVPDDVTATLAIPPTRSFAKGDAFSKRNVKGKRPWGLWALEFGGTDVQDVAECLLGALRGKEEALSKVADMAGVQVAIAIWWDPPESQGGFTLPSATLAQLCALSTQVHFYFPG